MKHLKPNICIVCATTIWPSYPSSPVTRCKRHAALYRWQTKREELLAAVRAANAERAANGGYAHTAEVARTRMTAQNPRRRAVS